MNQVNLQPTVDFNIHWHLPAHFYSPMNNSVFRVCVFAESQFQPLAKMIRGMVADRPSAPESVLVRAEAGVAVELLQQLNDFFSELLPEVAVCFEAGFTKDWLYQYLYTTKKMMQFYKSLAN